MSYKAGTWNVVCQVCGFEYKSDQLQKRWDGLWVCKDDFELRHPSDFIRTPREGRPLPYTSPEPTDVERSVSYVEQTIAGPTVAASEFYLPLADLGDGEVDISLTRGTGSGTFVRATTATTVNEDGLIISVAAGVPRSYYDPTSRHYLGYLSEGGRTNLCLQSVDFGNSSWVKQHEAAVDSNVHTAPDGTLTADRVHGHPTGTSNGAVFQSITLTADTTYTFSVWLKQDSVTTTTVGLYDATAAEFRYSINIDVSMVNGVVTGGGGATTATMFAKRYPNGWVRFSLTTATGTNTAHRLYIYPKSGALNAHADTIFIWGAQLEANLFASTYIPTTTASVTRDADVLTFPTTGNASITAGTMYAEVVQVGATGPTAATFMLLSLDDGSTNNRVQWRIAGAASLDYIVVDGGVTQAATTAVTVSLGVRYNLAGVYAADAFLASVNAGIVASDVSGTIPTIDTICIGNGCSSQFQNYGAIRNVRIWQNTFSSSLVRSISSGFNEETVPLGHNNGNL